jgi:cell division protein FtsI (penicillin-binding protein 3)
MDTITVRGVIRESSNIGAAKLAEKLEPGVQYSYLRDFGFGTPTGITFPSESGGRLRRPEEWSALSQASLAMGYEISVTSLQLATAYSALANDGVLMRPHLVEEVRNASGEVVYRREPTSVRRVVSEEVASHLRSVLRSVVEEGTATRASMTSLPLAGKTGTARLASSGGYRDRRYAASFVGFAPAKDPKLLVLTKLEDPQGDYYGGLTAAPVSRMTLQAALSSRGTVIPGDSWNGESLHRVEWGGPPARAGRGAPSAGDSGPYVLAVGGEQPDRWSGGDEGQTAVLPDLSGMTVRGAVARLHELGLQVELRSGGEVRSQRPAPGTRMAPGDTVVLH